VYLLSVFAIWKINSLSLSITEKITVNTKQRTEHVKLCLYYKSVFSLLNSVVNIIMTLPAFAALCAVALLLLSTVARYRSIAPPWRSAANPPFLLSNDRTGRRTYGQTDAQPFHRSCSAYYAGSVSKLIFTESQ